MKKFFLLLGLISFLFSSGYATHAELIERIFFSTQVSISDRSIITDIEWDDLEIDSLVHLFDKTSTVGGHLALRYFINPIHEEKEIIRRQRLLQHLVENEDLYIVCAKALRELSLYEDDVLAYFDNHNFLTVQSQSLYYQIPFCKRINERLNRSIVALESSFLLDVQAKIIVFLQLLCLDGLRSEFGRWLFSDGEEHLISLTHGLKTGLELPLKQHSWQLSPEIVARRNQKGFSGWEFKDYVKASFFGSLKDRYTIWTEGYQYSVNPITGTLLHVPIVRKGLVPFMALGLALLPTFLYDAKKIMDISSLVQSLFQSYNLIQQLHNRTTHVSRFLGAARQVCHYLKTYQQGVLQDFLPESLLNHFVGVSEKYAELINILQSKTFRSSIGHFYSRGKVLKAHRLFLQIKQELIPLLQAVAELDAFVSVASTVKEYKKKGLPLSWCHFISSEKSFLKADDLWLPLITEDENVFNSVIFDFPNDPLKMIITGPNGCGKSIFLKTLGISIVLAQSFGIACANFLQLSIVHGLRTQFSPRENIDMGLSSYMAEVKAMNNLVEFVAQCNPSCKGLVLIDEPFRSTIESESSRCLDLFCDQIKSNHNSIVCMATHIFQPTLLSQRYNDLFCNYQVRVLENMVGEFTRTFTLEKGVATWWFFDAQQRVRFLNWLMLQKSI